MKKSNQQTDTWPSRASISRRRLQVRSIARKLEQVYGSPRIDRGGDPLGALIRTILSQNTNDALSRQAYRSLRNRFPAWQDVMDASTRQIAAAIRIGGLSRQKSRHIKQILRWLQKEHGSLSLSFVKELGDDRALEVLTSLPGVGPKTAHVLLLFAFGRGVFPVDTHILRVSKRLGVVPLKAGLQQAHRIWSPLIPEGKACPLHLNLIRLGREICRPGRPFCSRCPVARWCPRAGVGVSG